MKHIRSALAAGLVVLGGAAVAAAQQPATQGQAATHAARGQYAKGERGPGKRGDRRLLKGIKLSAAEKANLKAVHTKYAVQMKALRPQTKGQPRTDAQREQATQLMAAQRNDLRAALSPANQSIFDANVASLQKRMAARADKGKARRAQGGAGSPR